MIGIQGDLYTNLQYETVIDTYKTNFLYPSNDTELDKEQGSSVLTYFMTRIFAGQPDCTE